MVGMVGDSLADGRKEEGNESDADRKIGGSEENID